MTGVGAAATCSARSSPRQSPRSRSYLEHAGSAPRATVALSFVSLRLRPYATPPQKLLRFYDPLPLLLNYFSTSASATRRLTPQTCTPLLTTPRLPLTVPTVLSPPATVAAETSLNGECRDLEFHGDRRLRRRRVPARAHRQRLQRAVLPLSPATLLPGTRTWLCRSELDSEHIGGVLPTPVDVRNRPCLSITFQFHDVDTWHATSS